MSTPVGFPLSLLGLDSGPISTFQFLFSVFPMSAETFLLLPLGSQGISLWPLSKVDCKMQNGLYWRSPIVGQLLACSCQVTT